MIVKVSAKSARLLFNGCDPLFIASICHSRCCDSPGRPTGMMVTVHPFEQHRIEKRGGVVADGFLQPSNGCRGCPFKSLETHLCGLHGSGDKPFGCIASPFTLNQNDTLIVRNRYKLLPCYKAGRLIPAYRAFSESLSLIFGKTEAERIVEHLDNDGDDLHAEVMPLAYRMLHDNDDAKHAITGRAQ